MASIRSENSHWNISPIQTTRCAMGVGKVSDATFDTEVLKASGPVVVDFWAEWCGPCRMIAPALEEIAGALGEKVKIVKLNVDENPNVAQKYGIMSIPTLMIFKNGEMAARQVGAAPKQKLEQWINTAVGSLNGRCNQWPGLSRPFLFGCCCSLRRRAVQRQHLARKVKRAGD